MAVFTESERFSFQFRCGVIIMCDRLIVYNRSQAAAVPPALAVLSWTPEGATETIAWVGKGIVYDTGGLSIKTKVLLRFDCMIIITDEV